MSMPRPIFAGLVCAAFIALPAQAVVFEFSAVLSGAAEAPPNPSAGTGTIDLEWDTVAKTMSMDVMFSGLTGTVTAAHIHAATAVPMTGTAGVATQVPTFIGFPLGVTAGSYSHTFDLTDPATYNSSYLTGAGGGTPEGAAAALLAALQANSAYLNIHSSVYGGGEIRGFLTPVTRLPDAVETAPLLLGSSLLLLGAARRRARGL